MKENIEEVIEYLDGIDIKIFLSGMAEQSNYIVGKANEVNEAVELLLSDYKRVLKENEELKEEDLMSQRALDIFDERKYRKKYLEERRAEEPNLLYPDADEIYERYYKLKEENEKLKEAVEIYKEQVETKIDAYIDSNYLPKQKIQDKIEELKKKSGGNVFHIQQTINAEIRLLQDLLEEKGE